MKKFAALLSLAALAALASCSPHGSAEVATLTPTATPQLHAQQYHLYSPIQEPVPVSADIYEGYATFSWNGNFADFRDWKDLGNGIILNKVVFRGNDEGGSGSGFRYGDIYCTVAHVVDQNKPKDDIVCFARSEPSFTESIPKHGVIYFDGSLGLFKSCKGVINKPIRTAYEKFLGGEIVYMGEFDGCMPYDGDSGSPVVYKGVFGTKIYAYRGIILTGTLNLVGKCGWMKCEIKEVKVGDKMSYYCEGITLDADCYGVIEPALLMSAHGLRIP